MLYILHTLYMIINIMYNVCNIYYIERWTACINVYRNLQAKQRLVFSAILVSNTALNLVFNTALNTVLNRNLQAKKLFSLLWDVHQNGSFLPKQGLLFSYIFCTDLPTPYRLVT